MTKREEMVKKWFELCNENCQGILSGAIHNAEWEDLLDWAAPDLTVAFFSAVALYKDCEAKLD